MVKIRYAGSGVVLSSRALIEQAITNTSAKFDNNIVANRFEQTTTTTYEVTIKCVSSRGKGAKRGTSGRRTQSCCWHAHGVFFEELFRLNPEIVIVAMGSRITSQSHVGWRDNDPEPMCDCDDGIVTEEDIEDRATAELIAARAHDEWIEEQNELSIQLQQEEAEADARCRGCAYDIHNHCEYDVVVGGNRPLTCPNLRTAIPNRSCETCSHNYDANGNAQCCVLAGHECTEHSSYVRCVPPPIVNRTCSTCRYSCANTISRGSECPVGRCLQEEGLQHWELYTPTPPVRQCTASCRHNSANHNGVTCTRACGTRLLHWEPVVTTPTPSNQRYCCDCKYSASNNNNERCNCSIQCLVGSEHRLFVKFVAAPAVVKTCETCKYWNTDCHATIGLCIRKSKWEPFNELEGFNPELYMQQPTVMPKEKGYMDFEGVA